MITRNIAPRIAEALADTPAVFLRGARQTGKTTLVKNLAGFNGYVTLDSAAALTAATNDPSGFLHGLGKPAVIDEVQRAPGLLLALKEDIDRERTPGRYLLTGSANVFAVPKVADSLAGRMELLTLYPFSAGEMAGVRDDFIARLFDGRACAIPPFCNPDGEFPFATVLAGGYPDVVPRVQARRDAWFDSYVTSLVERDVRDISNIQDRSAAIRLLSLLATRTATLLNAAEVSRSAGIPNTTLARYVSLFEALFIIYFLPAWSFNSSKRLVKSPKLHFADSGLASHLAVAGENAPARDPAKAGRLFETYVVGEIVKQATWTQHRVVSLSHYRSQAGEEVDLVLEDARGDVAAVEVKLSRTVSRRDIKGLTSLRDALGDRFAGGALVYTGEETLPLGDRLTAVPVPAISALSAA
ncbi:MAG: ATP-binding protein [Synergistaceae bacterium]|jgi:predicted AAA+ superfamily ATPase|nr:ATP-binding protein [Synergistaceae bacterium]